MTCAQCGSVVSEGAAVCGVCGAVVRSGPVEAASGNKHVRKASRWMVRVLLAAVVLGGIALFANQLLRTYHPVVADQPVVAMTTVYPDEKIPSTAVTAVMDEGYITIALNEVKEFRLVRFFDPEGKQEIPLIAYITPTGKLVTAMSTSEHCGSRDFYLQGNNIHCTNCASYWNMSSFDAYACCARYYPDPLPSVVVGDRVRIDAGIVRNWESRL